jgi:hypothetical protein
MPIRESEKARYPKDWKVISKRIRFERAKGRCEWPGCEAPHGETVKRSKIAPENWFTITPGQEHADLQCYTVKIILTVAHLDHCPENCADDNLLALCQLHHLRLDAKLHAKNAAATRLAKKVYPLFA